MSDGKPRALVIEDSPAWQGILTELLEDLGLAVDVAQDLEGARRQLRTAPHRLAVIDLSLGPDDPGNRDGLHVLDAVRNLDPGCSSVLLTGFATVEIAVSALTEYGAYTCLRKEAFRRSEFRQVVRRLMAVPSPAELPWAGTQSVPGRAPQPGLSDVSTRQGGEPDRPRVLLVEDDAGWRSLLAELLGELDCTLRVCLSFGEALGYLQREKFELAVVDLSLASSAAPRGNRDGFQVLRKAKASNIPTLVVSGLATPDDLEQLYSQYGTFACLEKQGFDRTVFATTVVEAMRSSRAGTGELARLTKREQEVLSLLVQGLTNKGIGSRLVISENTVKRYLKNIYEKLDVDSRASAVATALGAGRQA